jgi:hypothetical protein
MGAGVTAPTAFQPPPTQSILTAHAFSWPIRSQAALRGVLKNINKLGSTLISVNPQTPGI